MQISILDTTLRDGMQSEGISYSVADKLAIAHALAELGVSYIEAGNPGSNPKDLEFFARCNIEVLGDSRLVAFGATRRKGIRAEEDPGLLALAASGAGALVLVGKSSAVQVREILGTTGEENLAMIRDSIAYLVERGYEVFFDAEHFFDAYREDPGYAMETLIAAEDAGASCLVLCDTNGGSFPTFVAEVTRAVAARVKTPVGIHCHDDCGLAVANSIAAVEAGAVHVQGVLVGFGERCGNTCLATLIPDLQLKLGYACIPEERMKRLTRLTRQVAEVSNLSLSPFAPYVGRAAFTHKAGMHADAVQKDAASFEHIAPELVGNVRRLLISELSGRSALMEKIHTLAPELARDSTEVKRILKRLKELELAGYSFEAAEASFAIVVRKELGRYRPSFRLLGYKTIGEQVEDQIRNASAIIHVQVGEQCEMTAAQGNGPVHALDSALRKALEVFYPSLRAVHLVDYKVRVLDEKDATAAKVRVLISSSDGERDWTTVGVSYDIIQASWLALVDSIEYHLIQSGEGNAQ